MAGKRKKGCGEREEWRRKRGGRIEGKSHKKMRQQKMAGGGGVRMDVMGVKQVKRQKRGEEKGLHQNGVKGAGGREFNRQRE